MVGRTNTGNDVCTVVINFNTNFPENIGKTRYLNQCYWKKLHPKPIQQVEESRELTDEDLEYVIGGASRLTFLEWAANIYNDHRKEQYDKQIN